MYYEPYVASQLHVAYCHRLHLRFQTHCRLPQPCLDGLRRDEFQATIEPYGIRLLDVASDEVDVLCQVSLRPEECAAACASKFKGRLSKWLRTVQGLALPEKLLATGYLACTVGDPTRQDIEGYIERQGDHHGYTRRPLPPVFVGAYPEPPGDRVRLAAAHNVSLLRYHLVFGTMYRRGVFTQPEAAGVVAAWQGLQAAERFALVKVSFVPDHVHAAVRVHPSVAPLALAVRMPLSNSSRMHRLTSILRSVVTVEKPMAGQSPTSVPRRFTRTQLYCQVWQQPSARVAHTYGISDVRLGKICKEHDIPKPGRGYWAKRVAGVRLQQPPLPDPEQDTVIDVRPYAHRAHRANGDSHGPQAPAAIVVPERLTNPHPLVKQTAEALRGVQADRFGRLSPRGEGILTVSITKQHIGRALLILDTLIKALGERGHEVMAWHGNDRLMAASVRDTWVHFSLSEVVDPKLKDGLTRKQYIRRHGRSPSTYSYERRTSGRLCLKLEDLTWERGFHRNWRDGNSQRLEAVLDDFISGMLAIGAAKRKWELELERWHKEREDQQRRVEEEESRRREAAARVSRLRSDAAGYLEAERIRSYVAAVQARAQATDGALDPEGGLARWVKWALEQADRLDPMARRDLPSLSDA